MCKKWGLIRAYLFESLIKIPKNRSLDSTQSVRFWRLVLEKNQKVVKKLSKIKHLFFKRAIFLKKKMRTAAYLGEFLLAVLHRSHKSQISGEI